MNGLYNAGIHLYRAGVKIASLKNKKAAKLIEGHRHIFETLDAKLEPGKKYVWIHAASLGEFEQGRPLIDKIKSVHPQVGIVLTFFSPSGYEVRKNYAGADVVTYLPFDTPGLSKRFLDKVNPAAAIFVKYEFWGNYLTGLARRGVPTYLVSAIFRENQIFFRPYGGMFRRMLRTFAGIFVQDSASAERLSRIGIEAVVAGDTRFDRVTDILRSAKEVPEVAEFVKGSRFTIIAGSSWEPDEERYIPWVNAHPDVRIVIAPHEFNAGRLASLREKMVGGAVLLSEIEAGKPSEGAQCLIIDCFGKLSSIYRYGDVAMIGGGFGEGIHNINEAAVYGMPVVFGPRHGKFKEARDLLACGGAATFTDAGELSAILDRFYSDPDALKRAGEAAGGYIKANIGAVERIWAHQSVKSPRSC